jgi:hypothetical protein
MQSDTGSGSTPDNTTHAHGGNCDNFPTQEIADWQPEQVAATNDNGANKEFAPIWL